jgi:hypothetical protein
MTDSLYEKQQESKCKCDIGCSTDIKDTGGVLMLNFERCWLDAKKKRY